MYLEEWKRVRSVRENTGTDMYDKEDLVIELHSSGVS